MANLVGDNPSGMLIITDVLWKKVISFELFKNDNLHLFSSNELPSAVYFITLIDNNSAASSVRLLHLRK
jgi:hypothetical protein